MSWWNDGRGRREGDTLRELDDGTKVTRFGKQVDSQRNKLYRWERGAINAKTPELAKRLNRAECVALISKLFTAHGIAVPSVRFAGRSTASYTGGYAHRIRLPEWGMTVDTILHESAHGIAKKYADATEAGHGPTFVRVYIDLVEKFGKLDGAELRKSARAARLKIAPKPDYSNVARIHGTLPKPTTPAVVSADVPKKRGRPKKEVTVTAATPKKRGRPVGSKNKPKEKINTTPLKPRKP